MQEMILRVIAEMNLTFEYYFEEYNEISSSNIWWVYDHKRNGWKHVANDCQHPGDLAIYYYTKGYCALYAKTLQEIFPEGNCFWDISGHMLFYYQDSFYDATGYVFIPQKNRQLFEILPPFNLQEFSKFRNISSPENLELMQLMKQRALEILKEERKKKKY